MNAVELCRNDEQFRKLNGWFILAVLLVYGILWRGTTPYLVFDSKNFFARSDIFINAGFMKGLRESYPVAEVSYPLFLSILRHFFSESAIFDAVVIVQLAMLLTSALMIYKLSMRLTRSKVVHVASFFFVSLSPALVLSALSLYSETFSGFFFVTWIYAVCRSTYSSQPRTKYAWGFLAALSMGCLILARVMFLMISLFSIIGFWMVGKAIKQKGRLTGKQMVCVVFLTLALPGLWLARNYTVYRILDIADPGRNGVVLAGRFAKSQEHYDLRDVVAGTINSISERGAQALFGDNTRYTWSYANALGYERGGQFQHLIDQNPGYPNKSLTREVARDIWRSGGVRYLAFGWFELVQLLFFETLGQDAIHVKWLVIQRIQENVILRGIVHVGLSFFYASGLFLFFFYLIAKKNIIDVNDNGILCISYLAITLFFFFCFYSLATCVIRYTFVVAPIYILLALLGWRRWCARFILQRERKRVNYA